MKNLLLTLILVLAISAVLTATASAQIGKPAHQPQAAPKTPPAIAKVDFGVFGLEIGQAVRLPPCSDDIFSESQNLCIIRPTGVLAMNRDPNAIDVFLDSRHCAEWQSGCSLRAFLEDGRVAEVVIVTRGRSVEKAINAELQLKYGPPTRIKSGKITPDVGNAYEVHDPEWDLPGLHIEYQVIEHGEGYSETSSSAGLVTVMTESRYQRISKPKAADRKM